MMLMTVAAGCLTLLMTSVAPQVSTSVMPAPQMPPRDTSATQVKGTASIKGKVVTAQGGRPMRRVQITLSSRELTESRNVSTNSQGVFEFTELPAGRYTLTASRGGYLRLQYGQRHPGEVGRPIQVTDGQKVTNIDFAMPRTSALVGRITDEIGVGQEVTVPDFAMVPGRVGTISGTVMSSSGLPLAGESVSMSQVFSGPGSSSSFGYGGAKIEADGTFTIRNVSPGEYKISVNVAAKEGRPPEGGATTVVFNGDDLGGVMLTTSTGATIFGRVASDTGEAIPIDQKMRVSARAVDSTRNTLLRFEADNGRVEEDLTFELKGLIGANRVSVGPLPHGWSVRSILYDGKDYLDRPIDVEGGRRVEGVTVVLSKTLPHVRGTLTTATGLPAEGTVLIFPDDPARWIEESRLIRSTRPGLDGVFEFADVIPGDYFVAALEYVRTGDWADPAFLENLRAGARRVRVEEGVTPAMLSLMLAK